MSGGAKDLKYITHHSGEAMRSFDPSLTATSLSPETLVADISTAQSHGHRPVGMYAEHMVFRLLTRFRPVKIPPSSNTRKIRPWVNLEKSSASLFTRESTM